MSSSTCGTRAASGTPRSSGRRQRSAPDGRRRLLRRAARIRLGAGVPGERRASDRVHREVRWKAPWAVRDRRKTVVGGAVGGELIPPADERGRLSRARQFLDEEVTRAVGPRGAQRPTLLDGQGCVRFLFGGHCSNEHRGWYRARHGADRFTRKTQLDGISRARLSFGSSEARGSPSIVGDPRRSQPCE